MGSDQDAITISGAGSSGLAAACLVSPVHSIPRAWISTVCHNGHGMCRLPRMINDIKAVIWPVQNKIE